MQKRNILALLVFVCFYVGFGAFLALKQESILYQPFPQDFDSCAEYKDAKKMNYNGTRMYVEEGERGYVVLYHGNAGSACDRDFYADEFRAAGYGYLIVEYAGYSNDLRAPSHNLSKNDAENVIAYLKDLGATTTLVIGESIGTGIASYHVSIEASSALLLISPFTSIQAVAADRFWFYPTHYLVNNAFDNVVLLKNYFGPVTIVHGTDDTLIKEKLGRALYDSLTTSKKTYVPIHGGGHNDLFLFIQTYDALRNFLNNP